MRLWIDNTLVINDWSQGGEEAKATTHLEAGGAHAIKVEYFEDYRNAFVKLEWSSPVLARQVVPASVLTY